MSISQTADLTNRYFCGIIYRHLRNHEQGNYRPDTPAMLHDNCALQLSDNNCELYGRSWNKEEQK